MTNAAAIRSQFEAACDAERERIRKSAGIDAETVINFEMPPEIAALLEQLNSALAAEGQPPASIEIVEL
jgi:hypothetical protein